jgi:hypothetical protein
VSGLKVLWYRDGPAGEISDAQVQGYTSPAGIFSYTFTPHANGVAELTAVVADPSDSEVEAQVATRVTFGTPRYLVAVRASSPADGVLSVTVIGRPLPYAYGAGVRIFANGREIATGFIPTHPIAGQLTLKLAARPGATLRITAYLEPRDGYAQSPLSSPVTVKIRT